MRNDKTPGPWKYVGQDRGPNGVTYFVIGAESGDWVTEACTKSDAQLIAAAPELLKALRAVVGELEFQDDPANRLNGSFERTRIRRIE